MIDYQEIEEVPAYIRKKQKLALVHVREECNESDKLLSDENAMLKRLGLLKEEEKCK